MRVDVMAELMQAAADSARKVDSVSESFARRMRQRREELHYSQGTVATLMIYGYSFMTWKQTTVAKVELGEREVKLAEAVALAEILGVPLSDMIGG